MLKEQISADLEKAFSLHGFAEPSVAQLKTACNVSLRTLYKHYPSKEAMIVGALEYRHQRYLSFLLDGSPVKGLESIVFIFNKLEQWMMEYAPHGCLSMNAMAAFPDNILISSAVKLHKQEVQQFLGEQSQREDLAAVLFLMHEGVSSSWPILGHQAITTVQKTLLPLLQEHQP